MLKAVNRACCCQNNNAHTANSLLYSVLKRKKGGGWNLRAVSKEDSSFIPLVYNNGRLKKFCEL